MDTPAEMNDGESKIEELARILQAEGFTIRTWASALEFLESHQAEMSDCAAANVHASRS
jgi:FixJ family two-component response regulator